MRSRTAIRLLLAAIVPAAIAVVLPGISAPAAADPTCTSTWAGASGASWSDPANWQPSGVPGAGSDVCILTAAGPAVVHGLAETVYARGTSMTIAQQLNLRSADIADSSISGKGTLTVRSGGALSGVVLSESVTVFGRTLVLSGTRTMCGGQLAVCLRGSSRLDTTRLWLSGGDIGGTSTATNPLTTSELFVTDGAPDGSYRVGLHLSSRAIFNQTTATDPADVVLAGWDRLAADGTLTGDLSTQVGGIVLPRSITAIGRRGSLFGARVLTPDGQYAAAALTRNDGALGLSDEAMLTPPGGTLLDDGHIEVGPTHATIDGVLDVERVHDSLFVSGLVVQAGAALDVVGGVTGAAEVDVDGTLTTPSFDVESTLDISATGRLSTGTISIQGHGVVLGIDGGGQLITPHAPVVIPNGGQLNGIGGCDAAVTGRLTLSARSEVVARLYSSLPSGCRGLYQVEGPVRVDGTLFLANGPGTLGDHHVVMRSTAGLTGRFASVTGDVNDGPNHWELSYTATEVVATLVAGNL